MSSGEDDRRIACSACEQGVTTGMCVACGLPVLDIIFSVNTRVIRLPEDICNLLFPAGSVVSRLLAGTDPKLGINGLTFAVKIGTRRIHFYCSETVLTSITDMILLYGMSRSTKVTMFVRKSDYEQAIILTRAIGLAAIVKSISIV